MNLKPSIVRAIGKTNARRLQTQPELLRAAEKVYAGLIEKIESAPPDARPIFFGMAALRIAICKAKGKEAV